VPRFRLDPLSPTGVSLAQGVSNVWEVTGGGGTGGTSDVEALDDLSDVIITGPGSGQVLTYNGSEWVNDSVGGTGDVVGPASSTDLAIARFDGATGKLLQNSTATLGDSGGIATTIADTGNAAGLTVTQNDTTNNPLGISVVNAATNNGIQINQTGNLAASKAGLLINQSGTIGSGGSALYINNDSAGRSLYVRQDGAVGANDRGVYVLSDTTSQTASGGRLVEFKEDTASSTIDLLYLQQDGTGRGIFVDHNNAGVTLHLDKDVTNANLTSAVTLSVDHTAVVNDGGTYTKTTPAVNIASNVTETSGTITDSAIVLDVNQAHADATGSVVDIDNDGTGNALYIQQDGTLASNKRALYVNGASALPASTQVALIYSNAVNASNSDAALLKVWNDNASAVNNNMEVRNDGSGNGIYINQQNGTGKALYIDNNNTGLSVDIDHDASSASSVTAVAIDMDNASTGGAIGLDISSVTATAGTVIGQRIALPSGGGTNYALNLSDTGGTAAGGITWGTDTNLYRSAADTLKTDDALDVTGALTGSTATFTGSILVDSAGTANINNDRGATTNFGLNTFRTAGVDQWSMGLRNDSTNNFYIRDAVNSANIIQAALGATPAVTAGGAWTFSADVAVPDEAYGVGWNASLEVPTKNALYDKIETMGGGVTESFVIAMAVALG
jgi:hypothetical protein